MSNIGEISLFDIKNKYKLGFNYAKNVIIRLEQIGYIRKKTEYKYEIAEMESEVPVCKRKCLLRISLARVNSGIMKKRAKIRSYNSKLEVTIPKWNLQNQIA